MDDLLTIAGKSYSSRLLVGTGKYKDFAETRAAIARHLGLDPRRDRRRGVCRRIE